VVYQRWLKQFVDGFATSWTKRESRRAGQASTTVHTLGFSSYTRRHCRLVRTATDSGIEDDIHLTTTATNVRRARTCSSASARLHVKFVLCFTWRFHVIAVRTCTLLWELWDKMHDVQFAGQIIRLSVCLGSLGTKVDSLRAIFYQNVGMYRFPVSPCQSFTSWLFSCVLCSRSSIHVLLGLSPAFSPPDFSSNSRKAFEPLESQNMSCVCWFLLHDVVCKIQTLFIFLAMFIYCFVFPADFEHASAPTLLICVNCNKTALCVYIKYLYSFQTSQIPPHHLLSAFYTLLLSMSSAEISVHPVNEHTTWRIMRPHTLYEAALVLFLVSPSYLTVLSTLDNRRTEV